MDLMPILSTLRRHKTAAALIVAEIALTSAIVCNALHLIGVRLDVLGLESGLAEQELVVLSVRGATLAPGADETTLRDLQALRELPGVKAATIVSQFPYGGNNSYSGVGQNPERTVERFTANNYNGGEQMLQAMGLRLVEGRDFLPEEVQPQSTLSTGAEPVVPQVIVNRTMARQLAPEGSALGKTFYVYGKTPSRVIGVVEPLVQSNPGRARFDGNEGHAMVFPLRPSYRNGNYLVRTAPAQRDAVLKAATAALEKIDPTRIVTAAKTFEEYRREYYAQDRSMAWLLGGVCVALLVVTAAGIVGLASFWVEQRTRMIGTRRALGATAGQILAYFRLENAVLTVAGIALGFVLAWGLSLTLMKLYELPRLPFAYLPAGAAVLLALGQLAVWAPARRAARLPPVAALRG